MMIPSNSQCDIARLMTKSNITDNQIIKELSAMPQLELDNRCMILDKLLKEHSMPFDEGWSTMVNDFANAGFENQVDKATMFVIYMNWKSKE